MSLPCDILIKPLQKFQSGERGGITKVWRRSGIHPSTFSKILSGKQKKLNYDTRIKLHETKPDYFPPPFAVEIESVEEPAFKLSPEAIRSFSSLQVVVEQANDAAEQGFDEEIFLQMTMKFCGFRTTHKILYYQSFKL